MGEEGSHMDIAPPKATLGAERSASVTTSTANGSEIQPETIDYAPMEERNIKHPFSRAQTSIELTDYFVGPRNMDKHSKWPIFLRMHGSILPEMLLPLISVAAWSTAIRCISQFVHPLGVNNVLLTVLGFVVGLGLSFRSSTAYERYNEGRKYWSQVSLASQNLARVIWVHGIERPESAKEDLLSKITGMNLIVAFSVALKHKLRFEPYLSEELKGFAGHLDTYAREATNADSPTHKRSSTMKAVGEYLGLSFAESNPMKLLKRSDKPLGNLPLEILSYLGAYIDEMVAEKQLTVPMQQTLAYNNISSLNDALTGCERILHTPLPIAYSIAIAQITWVYIIVLPFQLELTLKWVMIPASVIAAYIILGILLIGREIENPFGHDVNDLPLDAFCLQIASDVDIIASRKKPSIKDLVTDVNNKLLFPLSNVGYGAWAQRSERVIREELRFKAEMTMHAKGSNKAEVKHVEVKEMEKVGMSSV
ncbi:UPF0187-domain-containing protein [Microthyrium microscopicum]|uniref:UPF0187-domain-containing protein n=1 Tax=Microthyrium microscopicum TaxID=703497 RepID=A0A6A6ULV2_9PEZI|nr:UPF0187-domain-containing protein [Microthyrium microscopicum]